MDIIKVLLILFLVYVGMKQKSEESRNVILIITGLLAFCMVNKEGFIMKCDTGEEDAPDDLTDFNASGGSSTTCTGGLSKVDDCQDGKLYDMSSGACTPASSPCPSGKACREPPSPCPAAPPATSDSPCSVDKCTKSCWFFGCKELNKCAEGNWANTYYCDEDSSE